jgi:hypothetical protein
MGDLTRGARDDGPSMKLRLIFLVVLLTLVFAQVADAASWNSRIVIGLP